MGVRRFQNPDGSLTNAGKRRAKLNDRRILKGFEIPASERTTKKLDKTWKRYESEMQKASAKANKALQKNDTESFNQHFRKSMEKGRAMLKYSADAQESDYTSQWLKTKLKDIENGTMVAGKDYIAELKTGWGTIDYELNFLSEKKKFTGRLVAH